MEGSHVSQDAGVDGPSPQLSLLEPARTRPRKLTPLERKERDRLRKKEQAQRRRHAEQAIWSQAKQLEQAKDRSSSWHVNERQEEELLLLRLDRDDVDAQRLHPAAAGYVFQPYEVLGESVEADTWSPVFRSFSHARCPPLEDVASNFRRQITKHASGSASRDLRAAPEAAFWHPGCHGYAMAKSADSSRVSPVFFLSGFAKMSLEQVANEARESAQRVLGEDSSSSEDEEERGRVGLYQCVTDSERQRLKGVVTRVRDMARRAESGKAERLQQKRCLICQQIGEGTVGCPGCFEFSKTRYLEVEASTMAQRLRTPTTRQQEAHDRQARHKALFLRKQLLVPPLQLWKDKHNSCTSPSGYDGSDCRAEGVHFASVDARADGEAETDYYRVVLPDVHAIRKHRAISKQFVTLHIKSLPVGNILTLQVDVETTVAAVYELFRANCDLPNRPVHLLLPTACGLFHLSEQVADATDTRMGVVRGELRVRDFNLHSSTVSSRPSSSPSPFAARSPLSTGGQFLLFAVAILHASSTPKLVANYMTQNFRLTRDVGKDCDLRLALVEAAALLPECVDRDACQLQLLPRVRDMQAFGRADRELTAAECREEREQLLRAAHLEAKLARLEQKKLENKRRGREGGEEDDERVSSKVRRALAFLDIACETGSAQQRLDKLWQLAQLLEEWKICKGGRLLDAERSAHTSRLVQKLQDETVDAFARVLAGDNGRSRRARSEGGGPLTFPVACLDRSDQPKLAARLGSRLGFSEREDVEFGLLLALDQDFDALDAQEQARVPAALQAHKARGYTSKALGRLEQDEQARMMSEAIASAVDCEWRASSTSSALSLVSSTDLLRPPFLRVRWLSLARAYARALRAAAFQSAKLDAFNALAAPLQDESVVMSSAQLERWRADAEELVAELREGSALAKAAHRVLGKKGAALLKRRATQRKQQQRDRERELDALRAKQEALELPKVSPAQALKRAFMADEAPKVRALLEPTPVEKMATRAGEVLGAAGARAARVARAVKKDYAVRAL